MIFVTVGTHQQPFERLVRALDALPADQLVVQHGPARPPVGVARAAPYMSFAEMLGYFEAAQTVITHAGVGSILCATNAGHVPIVVPRLKRLGEHVDDHQAELIRELDRTGTVLAVWDVERLGRALTDVPTRTEAVARGAGQLQRAVREALMSAA